MNPVLASAAGGLVATVPMTAFMLAAHSQLPPEEQYPLPPAEITEEVTEKTGSDQALPHRQHRMAATLVAHFGYGTAAATLFPLVRLALPAPSVLQGMAFGIAVWSTSYLVALPAAGILSPATEHPPRRTGLMIAAHLIWGAGLGVIASALSDRLSATGKRGA